LHAKALVDRRNFDRLTKSELKSHWSEFIAWLTSPGEVDSKKWLAALYVELCNAHRQRGDHSD
jgi:hypothetical protein